MRNLEEHATPIHHTVSITQILIGDQGCLWTDQNLCATQSAAEFEHGYGKADSAGNECTPNADAT